jgi:hypothetical protein
MSQSGTPLVLSYALFTSYFLAVQGMIPAIKTSVAYKFISATQNFFNAEHKILYGERAVEIYGISCGYLSSIRLIQPGQHDV